MRRLGEMGKTIIVSSHILPELADICNKIGIIDRGVMTVNSAVEDVMQQVRQRVVLQIGVVGDLTAAAKLLEQHGDVDSIEEHAGPLTVMLTPEATDYSELSAALVDGGHRLTLFREEEVNLESAFMALTKGTGKKI